MSIQQTISPIDGSIYAERTLATVGQIDQLLTKAAAAQRAWAQTALNERQAILTRFVEAMNSNADAIGEELTWQMGRPIRYAPSEIPPDIAVRPHIIDDAVALKAWFANPV